MPRKKTFGMRPVPQESTDTKDCQQLLLKADVPSQQRNWGPSLDQEDPEPSPIKEEQEELWTSHKGERPQHLEEVYNTKATRFEVVKDLFKQQLLTAARGDLIGHFYSTISEYEKELSRQQKLLDVVLKPEIKQRRADVHQLQHRLQGLEEADATKFDAFRDVKDSFKQQLLTAARGDLIGHFDSMISEYEKELSRQQKLLDVVLKPEIKLRRADIQQLLVNEEEVPPEQQDWSPRLNQKDPELPHIKEEQEELWTSQKREYLQGLQEADITMFTLAPVLVKSEDDEEKPQSSHLHQTEQMATEADGEDCRGPESTRDLASDLQPDIDDKAEHSPEPETEFGDRNWNDPGRKIFHCFFCGKTFKRKATFNIHLRIHTGVKPFSCSLCSKSFSQKARLDYHLKTHTREKPFSCSVCSKSYGHERSLKDHMANHTGVKPFSCSHCGTTFRRTSHLKIHNCVRKSFATVPVKTEDDEENLLSSQLHQTDQIVKDVDREDCGGPEIARTLEAGLQLDTSDKPEGSPDLEIEVGDGDWRDPGRKTFSCSNCDKTFRHKGNLNMHMRTHTGVKPFNCSLCNKSFTQKASRDCHLKTHTREKPFCCSICSKTYRHKGALKDHVASHVKMKPFSCSICGETFRGKSQLKIHKCTRKSSQCHKSDKCKKSLRCSECNVTFPNNYLLVTHIRMHKGKELFTCKVCGAKRHFISHLEIHMRTHTGERPYSCPICDKRFSQKGIVKQHMAIHSGVKPFNCNDCGRRFCWEFQIKKHKCPVKQQQGGLEPTRIFNPFGHLRARTGTETRESVESNDSVDIGFWKDTRQHQSGLTYRRKKGSVNDRLKTEKTQFNTANTEATTADGVNMESFQRTRQHQSGQNHQENEKVSVNDSGSDNNEKPLRFSACQIRSEDTLQTQKTCHTRGKPLCCLFCKKEFATGGYLTRHISVHTGLKLLTCIVCEKTFSSKSELLTHQCVYSQLHQSQTPEQTDRKLFSCSWCGKGYGHKQHLQLHMRLHAGEKPLRCSVCDETFVRHESLSSHMACHTAEKPFHCSVCSTDFIDVESLIKHMRIHTRQTQFSCSICDKEFTWRRCLTKHMEVHAKEKLYWCSTCERRFTQLYQLHYHRCIGKSSQPHETEKSRGTKPGVSSTTGKTEAKGEDCGGPEPARSSDPTLQPCDSNGHEANDSNRDWKETREPRSSLNFPQSDATNETDRKPLSCSERDKTFPTENLMLEKPFHGSRPENYFTELENLSQPKSAKQEEPELPHIKEEHHEVWISQEGEHLQGLEELTYTPVPVKSEDNDEKPQSSQLCRTEQLKSEADGEDCGGAIPDPDSNDSVDSDFWKDNRERPTDLISSKNDEVPESFDSGRKVLKCSNEKVSESFVPDSDDSVDSDSWKDNKKPQDTCKRPYICSECGKRFFHVHHLKNHMRLHIRQREPIFCSVCGHECLYKSLLKIHMRTHTGEKPFVCPVCGKKYAYKASMQSHMSVHSVEKRYSCSVCDKSFAWYTELKYHQCVGHITSQQER